MHPCDLDLISNTIAFNIMKKHVYISGLPVLGLILVLAFILSPPTTPFIHNNYKKVGLNETTTHQKSLKIRLLLLLVP
jgi:hypothetical protein